MFLTILYWISTGLLSLLYFTSALLYVTKTEWVKQNLIRLKFSAPYLPSLLVVVKILGPLAILSRLNVPLSDLAYAGMFFHLILSTLAHLGVHKVKDATPAMLGLLLLITSFTTQNIAHNWPSPYAPLLETNAKICPLGEQT